MVWEAVACVAVLDLSGGERATWDGVHSEHVADHAYETVSGKWLPDAALVGHNAFVLWRLGN